jgi:hypothetical protein
MEMNKTKTKILLRNSRSSLFLVIRVTKLRTRRRRTRKVRKKGKEDTTVAEV